MKEFQKEELAVWRPYIEDHFIDLLNGKTTLEETRDNLAGFRNSKHYTGNDEEFKEITHA